MSQRTCSVDGCERRHKGRGYCSMHLDRLRRGTPIGGAAPYPPGTGRLSAEERFWSRVEKTDDCWLWQGAKNAAGYGHIFNRRSGRTVPAHRFAYELLVDPIPDGLVLDHLCRTPSCVKPAHLEPVTQRENLRRGTGWSGTNAQKTHCKRGHALKDDNLVVDANGARQCRRCNAVRRKERTVRERERSRGIRADLSA